MTAFPDLLKKLRLFYENEYAKIIEFKLALGLSVIIVYIEPRKKERAWRRASFLTNRLAGLA